MINIKTLLHLRSAVDHVRLSLFVSLIFLTSPPLVLLPFSLYHPLDLSSKWICGTVFNVASKIALAVFILLRSCNRMQRLLSQAFIDIKSMLQRRLRQVRCFHQANRKNSFFKSSLANKFVSASRITSFPFPSQASHLWLLFAGDGGRVVNAEGRAMIHLMMCCRLKSLAFWLDVEHEHRPYK